jgi:hypothetical protein
VNVVCASGVEHYQRVFSNSVMVSDFWSQVFDSRPFSRFQLFYSPRYRSTRINRSLGDILETIGSRSSLAIT